MGNEEKGNECPAHLKEIKQVTNAREKRCNMKARDT